MDSKLLLTYIILSVAYSTIRCEQLNLIHNSLPKNQKDHSLGIAMLTMEESDDTAIIANKIADEMTNKFGDNWYCFAFANGTGSMSKPNENPMIQFSFNDFEILLFTIKPLPHQELTIQELIKEAISSSVKVTNNGTENESLFQISKESLKKCDNHISKKDCFNQTAEIIRSKLNSTNHAQWQVSVGQVNSCFEKYTNENAIENIEFSYGQIYFQIVQLNTCQSVTPVSPIKPEMSTPRTTKARSATPPPPPPTTTTTTKARSATPPPTTTTTLEP